MKVTTVGALLAASLRAGQALPLRVCLVATEYHPWDKTLEAILSHYSFKMLGFY